MTYLWKMCIRDSNMGVSKTRNDGLAIVKGEYIAFVDGDDYVAPSMIEDCLFTIQKEQVDVVVFDIGVLENGTIIPRHMDERHFVNIKSCLLYTSICKNCVFTRADGNCSFKYGVNSAYSLSRSSKDFVTITYCKKLFRCNSGSKVRTKRGEPCPM